MLQYIPLVGDLIGKIFGNKEKREEYQSDARSAVYQQFASEFGNSQTWWDSLIDGLNRLPRPFMTFGTIYLFWLCWHDPMEFIKGARALQAMPGEGWAILGAIVTFWFAAKLPKDFGKMKARKDIEKIAENAEKNQQIPVKDLEWLEKVRKKY